jgi:hypothetical protein
MVFCLEDSDQPSGTAMADVSIALSAKPKEFQSEFKPELLDGVTVLRHEGAVAESPSGEKALYLAAAAASTKTRSTELTMIPYYAWANRKPTAMQVWVPFVRT